MLVNGLGLGNATRCHAICEELARGGDAVTVATSGNGAWYLDGRSGIEAIHPLVALRYGSSGGRLSVVRTLLGVGGMLRAAWDNERRIQALIESSRPDVAVVDSVYHLVALKRAGVPIVAVNNADVVHMAWQRFTDRPSSVRAQFHVVEENDYRFHRWMVDAAISPVLDPSLPQAGPPFVRVPPIVRAAVRPSPREGAPTRVLVMLSGSVFGSPVRLDAAPPGVEVDVVGRDGDGNIPGVRFHGKVRDAVPFMEAADLAVINGGFSAVSEAWVMRRPMIVVPVANHAEQWINARTVADAGVGMIGDERELSRDIGVGLARLDAWRAAYARLGEPGDGAAAAAAVIREVAGRRQVR
jgi:hypothetical protein